MNSVALMMILSAIVNTQALMNFDGSLHKQITK